ncbi:MAG TPA: UDP-N-acetylglucosamine--N-acetylmuramyl-(pentapeptide) pyrophosphoryl-undecaprenol N-acetylglucosamine transferase [Candidatus Nitrosocosmicus sp.]|nr:UDP-N-acetylglucosamine--N-acetylmuramyl-(pentapeptide) pyrophosphoryl-undecaprenol N-acetylglucosamine transferase [Candidatus Nitrosocosmicus sp.]
MKILVTGGHITPALAVIDELLKYKDLNVKIIIVGRKFEPHSFRPSFEYQEAKKKNIRFIHLEAGRLTRLLNIHSIVHVLKFPLGLIYALKIIYKEKPDKIISFGGYIALSVAIAGWILRVPIYTHEQTITPGITNKFISNFAQKVFITFPESARYFNKKTILTGNPLRSSIFKIQTKLFPINTNKSVIYITGGSLGSHSINVHIESILDQLLKEYIVIHQTGDVKEFDDYERLSRIKDPNYFVLKHVMEDQLGYILHNTGLIISRSGANTILEIIALKKPSILIPLPWSANQEQKAHALLLQKKGVAEIFDQKRQSNDLYELIQKMIQNKSIYEQNFDKLSSYYNPKAAEKIANEIIN